MTWEEFWGRVRSFFESNVWNIVLFFTVLILGLLIIKIFLMILKRIMRARKVDEMAIRFVANILRFALLLLLVLSLLSIVGVPISGIIATISAAVLAVGMALKDFMANVASGIILIGSKKYKAGDFVQVAGVEGSVVDINFLFTTLKTPDSTQVTLPNNTMVNSPVTNLGAYSARRVAITFSVAYESDTRVVVQTLVDVMNSCGLVYEDPAPAARLKVLGESSLDYFCTCFCDNADYWEVYFYIMEQGFDALKRAGITVPFRQVEVSQKKERIAPIAYEKLPERQEKVREETFNTLTAEQLEDMSFQEITDYLKQEREYNKRRKNATKSKTTTTRKPRSSSRKTPAKKSEDKKDGAE